MKRVKNRRLPTLRIAISASVILGVITIILVGAAYQRQSASQKLDEEKNALEENINSLNKINQEELDTLQTELDSIRSEVIELEASFPELGAPFAIYQRALDLSQQSQVDLQSITSLSTDLHDTNAGDVIEKQYSLDLVGSLEDCITFIGSLEQAGRDTLTMKSAIFEPPDNSCSIEISVIGFTVPVEE